MTYAKLVMASAVMTGLVACTTAGGHAVNGGSMGPGGNYEKVSELVALPDFIPGMGTLYVQPDTLPAGPFLAYDRDGRHVSTVYMIPLDEMNAQTKWTDLDTEGETVRSVDITYNPGHPGVNEPHYHVMLWHVAKSDVDLEA